ncbi:WD repeat-containing protein on Y chromosome-like [Parasteatoda tepidariorum]|uniref:WD repeat-containing protein on Y chromosome-like n=1 Tax=Parasteatoda tepidariorum TaxID=114398 RepID=UPI0039BC4BDD
MVQIDYGEWYSRLRRLANKYIVEEGCKIDEESEDELSYERKPGEYIRSQSLPNMHISFAPSEMTTELEHLPKKILSSESLEYDGDLDSKCESVVQMSDESYDEELMYKLTNTDYIFREYKRIKRLYRGSSYESLAEDMNGMFNVEENDEERDSGYVKVDGRCSSDLMEEKVSNDKSEMKMRTISGVNVPPQYMESHQVCLQPGKSERIVKILDLQDLGSLLFVGQKGTVVFRNLNLRKEQCVRWDLCSSFQKQQFSCLKTRRNAFTVTDASYLEASQHYCLATTNRTLHFMHAAPSAHWETFRVVDLPTVPTCLENNFQEKNSRSTNELFVGDHVGNVYVFTFFFPRTMLFSRNFTLGTQRISFKDLEDHRDYIKCKKMVKVHNDLIDKIKYVECGQLFSTSKLDTANCLVRQDLTLENSRHVYRHRKGITCFDVSLPLKLIVTGSKDFIVRMWNMHETAKPYMKLTGHRAVVSDLCFTEKLLISICKEGEFRIWEISEGNLLQSISIKFSYSHVQSQLGRTYILHAPARCKDDCFVSMSDCTVKVKLPAEEF